MKRSIAWILLLLLIFTFISCDDETCWVCLGNGRCYTCNGKGIVGDTGVTCSVCNGTPVCLNCRGTGKIKRSPF